jgi:hypothetical protein
MEGNTDQFACGPRFRRAGERAVNRRCHTCERIVFLVFYYTYILVLVIID